MDKKHIYFYPFLISAFLGEDKFICVRCFEKISEYSAAACTRSGDFLEQVITTSTSPTPHQRYKRGQRSPNGQLLESFLKYLESTIRDGNVCKATHTSVASQI